ncbi:MAG: beta-lactamase family protein [Acetobacteraceae bacterium]|nr:beta-lactamase family protein [Acetobacteraceae bacterium]
MGTSGAAIERLFTGWTGADTPGLVVAATRGGAVVHQGAYGMADLAQGVALGPRTRMRIGSQTKQFTVLLALMLEREGKLDMEAPVHRYAPWLAATPAPVTLRHLASNTSGLRDFLEMMTWSGLSLPCPSSRADARAIIGRHGEVNFPPGEQMIYCNTGFFLLSEIIEEVSGRSYDELLRQRITGPLGMDDTLLQKRDAQVLPRAAMHHTRGPDGVWERAHWGLVLGGEGGMTSTLEDMLRWQAHLASPTPEMAALLARMEVAAPFSNGSPSMYALGFTVTSYRGLRNVGHGGGVAGGRSESVRFPAQAAGVVILGNRDDIAPFSLARRVADVVLADQMAPRPDPAGLRALAAAAGMYRQEDGDEVFEITDEGGEPRFTSQGGGGGVIEPLGDGGFAPERAVVHLSFGLPGGDGVIPARWCGAARRYRPVRPGSGDATALAGAYGNAALGIDAVVSGDGGMLVLRSDYGALRLALSWIERDLLMALPADAPVRGEGKPWAAVLRVEDGGLVLTSDRTKNLRLGRVK